MSEQAPLFTFAEHAPTSDFSGAEFRAVNYLTASKIVTESHYLGAPGSSVHCFGMYLDNEISGVITYGTIPGPNAAGICGKEWAPNVLELTRLFLYDWAGQNAESTFIAASFRLLASVADRMGGLILISYADTAAGHIGTVYQSTNWLYTGVSMSSKVVLPNGEVVHSRVASDSRKNKSSAGMERVEGSAKHRYIQFLGDKRQRRLLRKSLKWPVLPYPK